MNSQLHHFLPIRSQSNFPRGFDVKMTLILSLLIVQLFAVSALA